MDSIFEKKIAQRFINRIDILTSNSTGNWGEMSVSQMLAHCSAAFEDNSSGPNLITRLILRSFVRKIVIGNRPYKKNMKTAEAFVVTDDRDFNEEKMRLIRSIEKIQELGTKYFENRKHPVFGNITIKEWNIFFSKHLNHHLKQFGV